MSVPSTRHMIHVTLYFAPESVPIALEALRRLFVEAWQEPQLEFCQVVQSAEEPGVVRIQEAWNATRKYLDEVRHSRHADVPFSGPTPSLSLLRREADFKAFRSN